jgi:hypothetical protein
MYGRLWTSEKKIMHILENTGMLPFFEFMYLKVN